VAVMTNDMSLLKDILLSWAIADSLYVNFLSINVALYTTDCYYLV